MNAKTVELSLEGLSVMVGIPAGRDLPALTVRSLLASFHACQQRNVHIELGMIVGSSVIQWARDEVLDLFLKSKCNRLFWIDSDMVWKAEDFIRMLAISSQEKVVCATYPAKSEPTRFFINHTAENMRKSELGLFEIMGTGLGFTVIDRVVLEELAGRAHKVFDQVGDREIAAVFRIDLNGRNRRGEDMAFFHDIRQLGYKVMLDPEVDLGHIGVKEYTGTIRDTFQMVDSAA